MVAPVSEPPDYSKMLNAQLGGFEQALGLHFTRVTPDEIMAEVRVQPHLLQPYGLVHGGVHCSIAETLCSVGAAIWAHAHGKTTVGLENSTSFLRAARGGTLVGRATPVHRGRRTQLWEAEILDEDGERIAEARVRMMMLDAGAALAGHRVASQRGPIPWPSSES